MPSRTTSTPLTRADLELLREDLRRLEELIVRSKGDGPLDSPYLSIPETARTLGVSRATVYNLIRTGTVPAYKVVGKYRVRRSDLESFVERCPR